MVNLTDEQLAAIHLNEHEYKINASAGSGKTTTLKYYAKEHPEESILYLAFNRSVRNEALNKFPKNAAVKTAHSMAYHGVKSFIKDKKIENMRFENVLKHIKTNTKDNIEKYVIAKHVIDFLTCYFNSHIENISREELLEKYVEHLDGEALEYFQEISHYVPGIAHRVNQSMMNGEMPITHDFYLKLYQQQHPRLYYDTILFDEAQDASGSMLDIILKQECKKILVGDPHQQIYSFRYAINSMEKINFPECTISQSFRFGKDIANLAKRIIEELKDDSIHIKGLKEKGSKIQFHSYKPPCKKTTIIGRTNIGIIDYLLLNFLDDDTKIYFEGGDTNGYIPPAFKVYDVINLDMGKKSRIRSGLVRNMKSLEEYKEYAEKAYDAEALTLINLYEKFGTDLTYYLQMIENMAVKHRHEADYTVSTVHKAKGMEYETVYLLDNFINDIMINQNNLDTKLKEEINILYVAITRAKNELILPLWLTSYY